MPRPGLILLDLNMPRMDGRETLHAIKKNKATRSIPVIVLTTSESLQDVQDSYELQASCFITKPVELKPFINVVTRIKDLWLCVVKYPETH